MTTYASYLQALEQFKQLPLQAASDIKSAKDDYQHAAALATRAASACDENVMRTNSEIERLLSVARDALEPLEMVNLVPRRILPSSVPSSATTDDITKALHGLRTSVDVLRSAVQTELEYRRDERERQAQEAAERARQEQLAHADAQAAPARRRPLGRIAVLLGIALMVLIIVVILLS